MKPLNSKTSQREDLLKFALITDLHIEYAYTAGVSNDCGVFSCCRPDSGPPKSAQETSGKWGDRRCDLPP